MANKPNNPSLWSRAKSLAKQKFDVYPSAYANGWAAKWYKSKGGTWRKAEYGMEVMGDGGTPDNEGFRSLPPQVQQKIIANMAYGGYMPALGTDSMYGGGGTYSGNAYYQQGGEPDGAMALGQINAAMDKLQKLQQFIRPDSDLEPWVSSKLTLLDKYADSVADYMEYNPEAQGMMEDMEMMPEMREGGGIPERYRNMGFSRVGQKKDSTRPGKKWMVLAKKGDQYKVVHGGDSNMQDFTQHGSEQRRENFWNRMGGKNSAKAQDPFSPLYWHKKLGKWQVGGEPQMEDYQDINQYNAALQEYYLSEAQRLSSEQPEMVAVSDDAGSNAEMESAAVSAAVNKKGTGRRSSKGRTSQFSVVDYLNRAGERSDFASRKELAESRGIQGYTGTADQNLQLLALLQEEQGGGNTNPELMQPSGMSYQYPTTLPGFRPAAPVYGAPEEQALRKGFRFDLDTNERAAAAASGVLGTGALGAGAYGAYRAQQNFTDRFAGKKPEDILKAIKNRGFRGEQDMAALRKAGLTSKEAAEALKGISFQKGANQQILKAARQGQFNRALETGAEMVKQSADAYKNRFKTAKPILDEIKKRGVRNADDIDRLRKSGLSMQEAQQALKGFSFAAPEARGFMNAVRQGYAAAKTTPLIKFLGRFEDGGMPMYQAGGDSMGEDIFEFFDPTGISSYDDVYRTFQDPQAQWYDKAFSVAGALPIVGKFGKAAKAAGQLSKMRKAFNIAGKVLTPVAQMDQYINPASRFVGGMTASMLQNAPRGVKAAAQFATATNRGNRFFTGMDRAMGQPTRQYGGPAVGQEMEVYPEEMEMLRQQGYQFDIQ